MTMKNIVLITFVFLFYSCGNRNEKTTNKIDEKLNDYSDTSLFETQLDSIFLKTIKNEPFTYVMKVNTSYSEGYGSAQWLFDSVFNFIRYENEWSGEGSIGKSIQGFKNSNLLFEIDTVNDNWYEENALIHAGMGNIKGIRKYYFYSKENNSLYSGRKVSLKDVQIKSKRKKLLYQDDFNNIQNKTFSELNKIKAAIKDYKDSVKFEKSIAKIEIKYSNYSEEYSIDSLLFVRLINDGL